MLQTYICHAEEDSDSAYDLYQELTSYGVSCWIKQVQLQPGSHNEKIYEAINNSTSFLICLSKSAIHQLQPNYPNGEMKVELSYASDLARRNHEPRFTIIPVKLEPCEPGDANITGYTTFKLYEDRENELSRIADHCSGNPRGHSSRKEQFRMDLYGRAALYFYTGDYQKSLNNITLILDDSPNEKIALSNKGAIHCAMGDEEAAILAFNKALEADSSYIPAIMGKAITLLNAKKLKDALIYFNNLLDKNPIYSPAWLNRANTLAMQGKEKEAIESLQRAFHVEPSNSNEKPQITHLLNHLEKKRKKSKSVPVDGRKKGLR